MVGPGSLAFRRYESEYLAATRGFARTLSAAEVRRAVCASDVVYIGDYHTLPAAQAHFIELALAALRSSGRRVVLGLELFEGRHQRAVDAFLAGQIEEAELVAATGQSAALWPGFRRIVECARRRRLSIVALDRPAAGAHALARRDAYAAARIAKVARAADRPLILVLAGQYHVARCHLPAQVERRLPKSGAWKHLIVFQNCERLWWRLARQGQAGQVAAVELRPGELSLMHTSPLVCQQTYLDHLELQSGDRLLEGPPGPAFRRLAQRIGRSVGVRLEPALSEVTVGGPAELDQVVGRLDEAFRSQPEQAAEIKRHILSLESCYVPGARVVWLSSQSRWHLAEEAAHFVRHCGVGRSMEGARPMRDAFYARCLEEALAYFAAKRVGPERETPTLQEWARLFQHGRGEERQIAAFVLAHKAAEPEEREGAARLLPLRRERLFHAVSHALGYLLGEALYRAWRRGALRPAQARALFRDPLEAPQALYLELSARFGR